MMPMHKFFVKDQSELACDQGTWHMRQVLATCTISGTLRPTAEGANGMTAAEVSPLGVGVEIRTARIAAGLKQDELAHVIGVSRNTISNWERGNGEPTITEWRKIAKATECGWLLGGGAQLVTKGVALSPVFEPQLLLPIDLPPSRLEGEISAMSVAQLAS